MPAVAQNNNLWRGFFSYNAISDITTSTNEIYAAAENAYFKKNIQTAEITKTSTVEGISGQVITQIFHSNTYKKTILGHIDGLIVVVNDTDGQVLNVIDILGKVSIPPNKKRINHFMEHEGKLYVSTDFGLCVYNFSNLEFGDTYFIGPSGANIEILQTTVLNNSIYAVAQNYGLLKANLNNPNLVDFSQWTNIFNGTWLNVATINNQIVATTSGANLYKFVADVPSFVSGFAQVVSDLRVVNNQLIATMPNSVQVLNDNLILQATIPNNTSPFSAFTAATVLNNNEVYVGTQSQGLIKTTLSNPTNFTSETPNGTFKNKVFAIQASSKELWAVYGDYSDFYNPYPLDAFPVSVFNFQENIWKTIPYEDLFGAKSITRIAINPKNVNQVYLSSNYSGVLKFENGEPVAIYNTSNSSLQTIPGQVPDDIRTNGSGFDKNGNFWVTNSLVSKSIHTLQTSGQWQGYPVSSIQSPGIQSFGRLAIDKNNTKWICTNFEGLAGFNEQFNKSINIREGETSGNLPSRDVRAVAVDNKNQLWIGTTRGLRILPSVDSFLSQNILQTNSIIILEDNLAQELLYEQFITDIAVDGANNKWIATAGAGVFFVSPDGQKTFNIFSKDNSPLPSNIVLDIDINQLTGEVFMTTETGMVSFKGSATAGAENLANVVVYPNPVRPEFDGLVTINGLMNKSNVKITDIEGNLVYETISEGGTITWNTQAFNKYKVASGVYMVFISSEDGLETKIKKIMIVR